MYQALETSFKQQSIKFLSIVFIAIVAYFSILKSPLFYFDDAIRVFSQTSINQGTQGRPLSDIIYLFFSNGIFYDFSPLSQIIGIVCILLSGMLIISAINKNFEFKNIQVHYGTLLLVTLPLNYAILCYRFDSVTMSFSMMSASLSFFLILKPSIFRIVFSIISFFFALSTYQPMSTVYFVLLFLYYAILENRLSFSVFVKMFLPPICACILYIPIIIHTKSLINVPFFGLPQYPGLAHKDIFLSFNSMYLIFNNIYIFFKKFIEYFSYGYTSFFTFSSILIFIIIRIYVQKKLLNICRTFLCISLAFITNIQILLTKPVVAPRTMVPVLFFIFFVIMYNLSFLKQFHRKLYIIYLILCIVLFLHNSVFLNQIGNACRDQYNYEKEYVYNNLDSDMQYLYFDKGLKNFAIIHQDIPPCHHNFIFLRKEYPFLEDALGIPFFHGIKYISYYPINYDLPVLFGMRGDITSKPIEISRHNYTIYKYDDRSYCVYILNNHFNINIKPFQLD